MEWQRGQGQPDSCHDSPVRRQLEGRQLAEHDVVTLRGQLARNQRLGAPQKHLWAGTHISILECRKDYGKVKKAAIHAKMAALGVSQTSEGE